jgi:peptide/nickel transport system substrate-binding protein
VSTAALAALSTHRGGTLRASTQYYSPTPSDPALLWSHTPLVYDGLVGYRRAGGSAGTALVANLAGNVPVPSPDGRTYRFRLRPEPRFSDGAPVTPEDVRVSLARLLAFGDPSAYDELDAIPGAARCKDQRLPPRARYERCDLSDGVETDDAARTVTFHLTRPDADFLHKLTNLLIVPAGSPPRLATTSLLPGTGPYMIERWNPRRGGMLVRNPRFRPWSPDRPDGFPDRVDMSLREQNAQLAAFKDGELDVAVFDGGTRTVARLRARYGARLHADLAPGTAYAFLNVLAPPFDDPRVRRALSYAVDRERMAEGLGSLTHKPACQMPPPGLQGYTPSCPFTADPNPAGSWTGPDLAEARRLVAASGTRGMKVEFWSARGPGYGTFGRLFRKALQAIGYRATVRTFPNLFTMAQTAGGGSRTRPQIGLMFWYANSLAHYTYLQAPVSCSGFNNLSNFCDPKFDARMQDAARARGPEAIEQWRRVDAELAAESPTVPVLNWAHTSVTSERVGNYQAHPLRGPLLEQLWVK